MVDSSGVIAPKGGAQVIIEQIENISKGGYHDYGRKVGVQISISGHLVVITPRSKPPASSRISQTDRKPIDKFTTSSASRMRKYLRECVPEYDTLITLTYPGGEGYNGERAKRDLKVLMQRFRREFLYDRGFSAFWFMEFQDRGSIHFHIFTNRFYPKNRLSRDWYEICGTEDKRHLYAGTRIERIRSGRHGISGYAAKYAAKHRQKVVPEQFGWSGRFWGVVGDRRTVAATTFATPYDIQSQAFTKRIKTIEESLEAAIFAGKARNIRMRGEYCRVIYITENSLLPIFRMLIDQANITASYKRTRESIEWDLFEKEDITDDTKDWNRMPEASEQNISAIF